MKPTQEYKRHLNMMLKTSMKIMESIAEDNRRDMQLWTILLNHQIKEALEMVGEKSRIEG